MAHFRKMNRQLPGPIPLDEFENSVEEFEAYIGLEWLTAQPLDASPLIQVWNRTDFLSSLELFTVAHSYRQMAPQTDAEWLEQYKKAIRSHNAKDILSQTYELVSAAMFSYGSDVKLCPPSHPGYDFTVSDAGRTIRVSCKKLGASNGEKAFLTQARLLYEHVRATAAGAGAPSFQMVLELIDPGNRLKLTLGELQSGLTHHLSSYQGTHPILTNVGGWRLTLAPLLIGPSDLLVDREFPSHQFICTAPHSQDEQRRFADRFKEAAQQLKRRAQPINVNNVNVIMIGLPPAVSFNTAAEWLKDKFSRENSTVSAVLLNRMILASTEDLSSTALYFEWAFITNPNAQANWYKFVPDGFMYKLKLPIGSVTEAESHAALSLGGELIELKDKYLFQRGQVNLEGGPRSEEMKISCFEASGIQYNFIMRIPSQGAYSISPTAPPDNATVLL